MSEQLVLALDSAKRVRHGRRVRARAEDELVYQAVVALRKIGHRVYRAGAFHRVIYDADARQRLKALISSPSALILRQGELQERADLLRRVLDDYAAKWSQIMSATVLSPRRTWRVMKFLATLDNRYLDEGLALQVPLDDCGLALPDGDIEPVELNQTDMLKLNGPAPAFARLAPILRAPKDPIGAWWLGADAPIQARGNYVTMTHVAPLTPLQRAFRFRSARNRLERSRIDLAKLIAGMAGGQQKPEEESVGFRRKRLELEAAEDVADRYTLLCSQICLYDRDPARLVAQSAKLHTALTNRGFGIAWETVGLPAAYRALQPGGARSSVRNGLATTIRAAALSQICKAATGRPRIEDLGDPAEGEEALYVFEQPDGQPFWFSPIVGGREFILAVGPTGSGKTFIKNTLTAHFLKYGGFARELDIDAGSETLAQFYGDDAGIVRLASGAEQRGLNPFVSNDGPGDLGFQEHMGRLARAFLDANDAADARTIDAFEQSRFDEAVQATLRLPVLMQTLEHFLNHLPRETAAKFDRWRHNGRYDGLFNAKEDGIGAFDKRLGVFNLYAFRDTKPVLSAMLIELFYRVTKLFEAPQYRHLPKMLDIDEAHHALAIPAMAEFIVAKARTWRKFNAGLTCWTQSPLEYLNVPGWDALRSAATTYLFLADGRMDRALYQKAFHLTDGQCEAIATLVPRREAFIVQPELGIAKKVILQVEPEQEVINTSQPQEVALRTRLIAEFGFEAGLDRTIAALAAKRAQRKLEEV